MSWGNKSPPPFKEQDWERGRPVEGETGISHEPDTLFPHSPPVKGRESLVSFARTSIARGSKSFALASRLFDRTTRERVWLFYAWCRACDDLADGQEMGHGMQAPADAPARVATIRALTRRALAGENTGEPAFDAVGIVAAECAIPARLLDDVIDGFALDAQEWRPRTEDDLYRYCYHVAGAVGVAMALIMGVPAEDVATLTRACDLGLAFQLANIARDLSEDDAAGRCYLPVDWLVEMDIPPGEALRPAYRKRLAVLGRRLADRAAAFETSARIGAAVLPFRSAWAVLAAAGIYGGIAREIARRGERAWDRRVVTTRRAKLGEVAKALAASASRKRLPLAPRPDQLWTWARMGR